MKPLLQQHSNLFPQPLRVWLVTENPARRQELTELLHSLGHIVAKSSDDAFVVMAEGVVPATSRPVLTLGLAGTSAEGSLPVGASVAQVDAGLRAVAAGLQVSARNPASGFGALEDTADPILLTPRETEVLTAAARGMSNKEIARDLGISLHTVKFHLESLTRKLGASGRTEAVAKAIGMGLLQRVRM